MTGSGTITDPYIITTAEELYSLGEIGGSDVHCRLGSDIDFNGTPYAENFQTIQFNFATLDAAGHCLRNIYINKPASTVKLFNVPHSAYVEGLHLENIICTAKQLVTFSKSTYNNCRLTLKNCTFLMNYNITSSSSQIEGSVFSSAEVLVSAELCTFAFDGVFTFFQNVFKSGTFDRCHMFFNIKFPSHDSCTEYTYLVQNCTITDSYFSGRISFLSGSNNMIKISDSGSTFSNFYSILELNGISNANWYSRFVTPCFYNIELIGSCVSNDPNGLYGLTASQCRNAEFLRAVGFECAGDEL